MTTRKKPLAPPRSEPQNTKPLPLTENKSKKTSPPGLVREKNALTNDFRNKKQSVLRRLGIDDPRQLENVPLVTPLLANATEGLPQVLAALRSSDDPDALAFIQKYDSLSRSDLKRVKWEAIAVASGIGSMRLLEISVSALLRQQQTIGQIISATSHAAVVKKSIAVALTDYGVKDREMMLNARGFLPVAKGAVINNLVQVASVASSPEAMAPESADLPQMEDDLKDIHGLLLGTGDVR